uniref:Amidinotransferase n=2 Tax=Steinernema glaseri TaxID=37863 RepID=A0A1I8A810_9BILA
MTRPHQVRFLSDTAGALDVVVKLTVVHSTRLFMEWLAYKRSTIASSHCNHVLSLRNALSLSLSYRCTQCTESAACHCSPLCLLSGRSIMAEDMQRAVGDVLKRVLMVPPTHFTVEYTINPWMGGVVDKDKAQKQWSDLKVAIEKEGVKVDTLDHVKGLPDMVFVCNSGIVRGNKVYLSRFQHKERTGEQEHYLKWFEQQGFEIYGRDYVDHFEGGGDACFSSYDTLWAGFGPRSNKSVYEKISALGDFDTVICELKLPQFYHLDTCFCPVSEKAALWYPPAFSVATQEAIKKRLPDSIAVSDKEANAFVCNAITIRKTVISPIGVSQDTKDRLAKIGYSVTEVDMSEFMKSGGACQCLVLKL